ncbi:GWxTD domain-containing protein [Lewinella cohaerens]|uniref:GWxTD domain-containing protein n=1 Tax=Lewinella cohaerens TaxID=70995 RepID=UPI00035C19CE|nr:GWxTD domain-containing protein [Lewinella cohaerens]
MKNLFFLAFLLMLSVPLSALDASLSFARFNSPQGTYVEVYLHVSGQTVTTVEQSDSTVQGAVDILVFFEQGERIIKYDKFRLLSPVGAYIVDFIDLKRYPLPEGDYKLRVEVTDANLPEETRRYSADLSLDFPEAELAQSDIQLLAAVEPATAPGPMVKNDLLMEPLPFNYYGRGANILTFYHEVYNSDQAIAQPFVVSYRVDKMENGVAETLMLAHKRQDPATVNPLLLRMDISDLPSGNYQLVVDVRNRERALLSTRSMMFQRSNPMVDAQNFEEAMATVTIEEEFVQDLTPEELEYSLRAISPLLPQSDVELVDIMLRNDSLRAQRMYLYGFWLRENRTNPEQIYKEFMEVAAAVDQMFQSGFRHGFETDRGYMYIKYGQPNDISRSENEPSAPPYEVWSYNEIERTNQNNVRFIFYNPSLAADDFILLHSDVIGERNNPQWELELYRDSPSEHPGNYIDGEKVNDNIGRQARRLLSDY